MIRRAEMAFKRARIKEILETCDDISCSSLAELVGLTYGQTRKILNSMGIHATRGNWHLTDCYYKLQGSTRRRKDG